jgi:DeoR/GlpR family transcriptional regulator of sugar metabolism
MEGSMPHLLKEERFHHILQAIQRSGRVTPTELSRDLGVSEITIRRDLRDLAEKGLLKRAHGGAVIAQPSPDEPPVIQRLLHDHELKEAIGRTAAALINDGDSVFIGSGSTTSYVARNLVRRSRLTVVTNALNIGMDLATSDGITVVVVGGMLRSSELSLIGHIADLALREVRVDKVIMGIPAINLESGLTNDYLPEVITDRTILGMASELILVADHSKFCKVASAYVAPLNRVTTLVTDHLTDPAILDSISRMGIKVLVAE